MSFRGLFESKVQNQLFKEFMQDKNVIFNIDETKDNIHLNVVVVPEANRKKGLGTKFMKRLQELAKTGNKTITLNISDMYADQDDPKADELEKWYKKLGFKMIKPGTKLMKYTP